MKRRGARKEATVSAQRRPAEFLLPTEKHSWAERLRHVLVLMARQVKGQAGIHQANHDTVRRTLIGLGPDGDHARKECGARMVVNLSSANVADFCRQGYKNAYDLVVPPWAISTRVSERRDRVDRALPLPPGVSPSSVYFGALELAGAGMRYYGDICLVLKPEAVAASTVVLDKNSFDVDRPPAVNRIRAQPAGSQDRLRATLLSSWSGAWGHDLAAMATIRMHEMGAASDRRWTTARIARALVDDEDYLEVLKQGRFGVGDIQEARLFATDVALDAWIASQTGQESPPRHEALIWRRQRIRAEAALRDAGIPVRVVSHLGRERN
ncbi:MAG: hypothetical protein ABJD97_01995 [Betaproteobacteria bacterium]